MKTGSPLLLCRTESSTAVFILQLFRDSKLWCMQKSSFVLLIRGGPVSVLVGFF